MSIARHSLTAVRQEVERLLATERFDLVHAEQLQALPQVEPAFAREIPVVLRAQNVESDLWSATAQRTAGLRGFLLRREAHQLAVWEGRAVRQVAVTLALTQEDAARLRELSGGKGNVSVVPAPFPGLSAATHRLAGEPAVVVFGSRGWLPNAESAVWFHDEVWPVVRAELPGAILHLFGVELPNGGPGVVLHPPPTDSSEAFAPGSILAVPLRIASGVRIKILEAWARGVPVVATPAALAGLDAEEEALVANNAEEFSMAFAQLHKDFGLRERVVEAGQRARSERHDPSRIARMLLAEYEAVLGN